MYKQSKDEIQIFKVSSYFIYTSYNGSQKKLRPIQEIVKCMFFMQILIADLEKFSSAIAKFLFVKNRLKH